MIEEMLFYPIIYVTRPNDLTYDNNLKFHNLSNFILDDAVFVYGERDHMNDDARKHQFDQNVEVLIPLSCGSLAETTTLCEKALWTILKYIHTELYEINVAGKNDDLILDESLYLLHQKSNIISEYLTSYWMNTAPQFDIHIVLYSKYIIPKCGTHSFIRKKFWKLSSSIDDTFQDFSIIDIKINWINTTN
jgi:hypothetical protein